MKVAIPVEENVVDASVCVSFGRAPYFYICDMETGASEFVVNSAAAAEGGAGIKAAQFVVDSGANILLTARCGQNAADVLRAADVKIYKTEFVGVEKNLSAFREEKLSLLTQFHAGFHGHR